MDKNDPLYLACRNGIFMLPDRVVQSLSAFVSDGFVYLRQDDDMLTISSTRVADGRRRVLGPRFRAPMFREATMLAIVDLHDSLQIMGVQWRAISPAPAPF
jgi:hypothetical protein